MTNRPFNDIPNDTIDNVHAEFINIQVSEPHTFRTTYKFSNGYGASVIHGLYSYGLELAVLCFDDNQQSHLTYNTPITDDVLGHLDRAALTKALNDIQNLPARGD